MQVSRGPEGQEHHQRIYVQDEDTQHDSALTEAFLSSSFSKLRMLLRGNISESIAMFSRQTSVLSWLEGCETAAATCCAELLGIKSCCLNESTSTEWAGYTSEALVAMDARQ
jgi:hypothetical protein